MSKIIVKSKAEIGFWRAGIHFTREGVELDTGKLKKGALEAIENEPNLVVVKPAESDADRKKREAEEAKAKAEADKKAAAEVAAAEKAKAEADKKAK